MRWISGHQLDHEAPQLAALVGLMALLFVLAGTGMAYVAGFHAVYERIVHAQWWWLAPSFGAVVLAFVGYVFAYRGLRTVGGGDPLDVRALLAVVMAGFGGFFARAGPRSTSLRCAPAVPAAARPGRGWAPWPASSTACWR